MRQSRVYRLWSTLLRKFKNGAKSNRRNLKSVFYIWFDTFPSWFCWRFTFEKYLKLKMPSQNMYMDSEIQFTVCQIRWSWPEGLAPYLSSLEKTKAQEKSLQFTEFQFILASWHRSLGKEHVMTHEKMNLLTGQLQTRLGHRKPHAVHSVTVFCNFKSVLVPPPHVSPRIPIPIIGYVQLQSSIAHTMTHFQTLNGSLFPAVLHITQIFYGTLALQRTQKGLGSCFPCSASWHSTMEDAML